MSLPLRQHDGGNATGLRPVAGEDALEQTYEQKKTTQQHAEPERLQDAQAAVRTAAAHPGALPTPPRADLPDRMRERMAQTFGGERSDLRPGANPVRTDAEAGGRSRVSFAPGMADARHAAMPAHALSSASAAPAAGPMQAQKNKDKAVQPEAKKVKSNGFFEKSLKGITTASDKLSSVAAPLADPDGTRESISSTVSTAKKISNAASDYIGFRPLGNGAAADAAGNLATSAVDEVESWGLAPYAKPVAEYAPLVGSAASIPTAIMNFGGNVDKVEEARKSGSSSALTNAQLDTASSANTAVKKGASFTKAIADRYDTAAAKLVSTGAKEASKASGYVGQGLSLAKDLYNLGESTQRKNSMQQSVEAMEQSLPAPEQRSEAEQEHLSIFRQGHDSAGQDQKQAAVNTISDSLGLASTVTKAAGAGAAGTGIDIAKKIFDFASGEVMSYEKDKFHTDTVEDKLHTKEAFDSFQKEDRLKAFHVSPEAYRMAQLRLQGYKSGTTDEAFEGISSKRAEMLANAAGKNEGWAQEYASNAGIDTEGINSSEDQKKAIQGAFLKSLGGNKDAKFHSRNVLEYNAFTKDHKNPDAKKSAEGAKEGAGGAKEKPSRWTRVKNAVKGFGAGAWESVKTGGKKVISAGKGIARGVKSLGKAETWKKGWNSLATGAKKAAGAIGRGAVRAGKGMWGLMTSSDARKKAWQSAKTGAANAAKYAWNVTKHSFTSRADKIRNWYQEGVDQLNVNMRDYKKMNVFKRMLWSAKNLPARMFHGTAKNKQATAIRFNKALTADEAAKHMAQFEAERAAQGSAQPQPEAGAAPTAFDKAHDEFESAREKLWEGTGRKPPAEEGALPEAPAAPTTFDQVHDMYQSDRERLWKGTGREPPAEEGAPPEKADKEESAPVSLMDKLNAELAFWQRPVT